MVVTPWVYYPKVFSIFPRGRQRAAHDFEEYFTLDNIPILRLPFLRVPGIRVSEREIRKLYSLATARIEKSGFKPDLVLSHRIDPSALITGRIAKALGVPLVTGIHSSDVENLLRGKYISERTYSDSLKYSTAFSFRSTALMKKSEENLPDLFLHKERITCLSGVTDDIILPEDKLLNRVHERKPLKIVTACNLIPRKNVGSILKALKLLEGKLPFELSIIGDGVERTHLEKLRERLALTSVKFLGKKKKNEVIDLVRKNDVFVMISERETFGLVYLEALANGCITVGSRGEGIDGTIVNGVNGFLCAPGDEKELAEILEKIFTMSAEEKRGMILKGYETAIKMKSTSMSAAYISKLESIQKKFKYRA